MMLILGWGRGGSANVTSIRTLLLLDLENDCWMWVADAGLRSEPVVGVPGVMVPPVKVIRGVIGPISTISKLALILETSTPWEASTRNKLFDLSL